MKKKYQEEGRKKVSASFMTGAISLVFMLIGYQTALFIHKASVTRILAGRDRPDTVYVIDPAMAESLLRDSGFIPDSRNDYGGRTGGGRQPSSGGARGSGSGNYSGARSSGSGNYSGARGQSPEGGEPIIIRKNSDHSPGVQAVRESRPPLVPESFAFNPNTVSVPDLVRLGFSEKQAQSIDNYRKKGGKFRRKSDFAKSFVVSDEIYKRLESYIEIPLLDINLADSAAFDGLPGIGGYFAAKMVQYRDRLGGSYSYPEQLMDIWNFDREKYDALSDLITLDSSYVRPYPLWTLPEDSLRLHPYIGSYQTARGIVIFRDNNKKADLTVASLEKAGILSAEAAAKLSRCRLAPPE